MNPLGINQVRPYNSVDFDEQTILKPVLNISDLADIVTANLVQYCSVIVSNGVNGQPTLFIWTGTTWIPEAYFNPDIALVTFPIIPFSGFTGTVQGFKLNNNTGFVYGSVTATQDGAQGNFCTVPADFTFAFTGLFPCAVDLADELSVNKLSSEGSAIGTLLDITLATGDSIYINFSFPISS